MWDEIICVIIFIWTIGILIFCSWRAMDNDTYQNVIWWPIVLIKFAIKDLWRILTTDWK
jgi:hypothetical protein